MQHEDRIIKRKPMKRLSLLPIYILLATSMSTRSIQAESFFEALANFFNAIVENASPKTDPKYSLTRNQVENYIDLYVTSIHYTLRPDINTTDITKIKNKITYGINNASNLYIWIQGVRWFNKDMIDEIMLSAIIEHIEESSYAYALRQTNSASIASKISASIRNNALAIIQKTSTLEPEKLRPFFGTKLESTVQQALYHAGYSYVITPNPTISPAQIYPSELCCICLELFSSRVERVFLYPCGHDMCKVCAIEYFFENNGNKKNCPLCRSIVNLEKLFEDLEI